MNRKQLNIDLAVGFMSLRPEHINLTGIRQILSEIKSIGKLIGTSLKATRKVGREWINETYELKFENCTVDVDIAANKTSKSQILKGYHLRLCSKTSYTF